MKVYITTGGRKAVGQLLKRAAGQSSRLLHDPDGAPLLADGSMHISISHSPHYCAIATDTSRRIGIDIEEPRMEQLARVKRKFLTPEELNSDIDLLTAWTIKEAVFKAAATPALHLTAIDTLTHEGFALLPDGRKFTVQTVVTDEYTLSTAIPI